jgi:uncharacterized membrane protein
MIDGNELPARVGRLATFASHLTRAQRRVLVLATAIGLPGLYAWNGLTATSAPLAIEAAVSALLLCMTLAGGTLIWMWTRNRVDLDAALDERERQVRDRVYVRSYQVLGTVVTAIVVILGLMTAFGSPVTLDFMAVAPFIVGNAIYYPTLPSLVYAWSEPDPLPEDA